MTNLVMTDLLDASTYEEWAELMDKHFPEGIYHGYIDEVKHLIDMTILNIGNTLIEELLGIMDSINDLVNLIQENQIHPEDNYEILKMVIQEYKDTSMINTPFDRTIHAAILYLEEVLNQNT